jgi:hypothetical protein
MQLTLEGLGTGKSSSMESRLPIPHIAMTQPIGQGVPSAKRPTNPEPTMPLPY